MRASKRAGRIMHDDRKRCRAQMGNIRSNRSMRQACPVTDAFVLPTGRKPAISRKHRPAQIRCSYCQQQWGPWGGDAIEPCRVCTRPLVLLPAGRGDLKGPKTTGLLDGVNMVQGLVAFAAIVAFVGGWLAASQLGQIIAMAMFVAATAHTTDGVLGFRSRFVRLFGQRIVGEQARAGAAVKIMMGLIAFAISLIGILLFGGRG